MIPRRITIHCSDTANGVAVPISEIDSWHKQKGWSGIGYHYVIEPDGSLERGRPLNQVGAHVFGENEENLGICMIGRNKFTIKQFESLHRVIQELQMMYSIPSWELYGHYEFDSARKSGKSCPNMRISCLVLWCHYQLKDAIKQYIL